MILCKTNSEVSIETTKEKIMEMSNIQAVGFALIPGAVEGLERQAIEVGNMAWDGTAKRVKYSRNALYLGFALTAIGATGATIGTTGAVLYTGTVLAILGVGITILAAKRLYNATSFLQVAINSGASPY